MKQTNPDDDLLSIEEVAEMAGVKPETIRVFVSPTRKASIIGGIPIPTPAAHNPIRWARSDIDLWIMRRQSRDNTRQAGIRNCHCNSPIRLFLDGDYIHIETTEGENHLIRWPHNHSKKGMVSEVASICAAALEITLDSDSVTWRNGKG